ncbi:MAG TPA: cation:dicarboxylase symporter family transporter, partial [Cytophagaceae bacterium]|nr:cation:dicarboxylase symporter family transporter [Cytophagaceae bacterium]
MFAFFSYRLLLNLSFQVLLAILAGILLGHFAPQTAMKMETLGTGFITLIKLFIGPIVFLTIVTGISGMSDLKKAGRIGFKSLVYFEIITTLALAIGIALAYLLKPGHLNKNNLSVQDSSKYTQQASHSFDWGHFFSSNVMLQVLCIAVLTGIFLHFSNRQQQISNTLNQISFYVFKALKYVMYLAPIAAFGGMAYTIGKFGWHTLLPLVGLMASVYLTMFLFVFVILGGILRYYKMSILALLKSIKEELLLVLGTSSSESALPSVMQKMEQLGCSKSVVGLVIPTGYSFNLDGTSIYLSMSVIFLAQLYNIPITFTEIITI